MTHDTKTPRVVFSHGKETAPWGSKTQVRYLVPIAERLGFAVDAPDYAPRTDPAARCEYLESLAPTGAPLVLVGLSMGGYVSAMACAALRPDALLLMAPTFYITGFPGDPADCPADTVVVHGWRDDVVPVANSYDFARARNAELHVVDDSHRLAERIDRVGLVFEQQLKRVLGCTPC